MSRSRQPVGYVCNPGDPAVCPGGGSVAGETTGDGGGAFGTTGGGVERGAGCGAGRGATGCGVDRGATGGGDVRGATGGGVAFAAGTPLTGIVFARATPAGTNNAAASAAKTRIRMSHSLRCL